MIDKPILTKSITFAIRIINLCKYLNQKNEFILSKQIIRSGTSIGANLSEAYCASSKKDFVAKFYIGYSC
jgi:four helix bundle protein